MAGLGDRLKLLRADLRYLPPRQQTLRGAIDWSYQLLALGEKTLLRRLGVFGGGFSLAAVQAVCNANHDLPFEPQAGIATLSSKSLLYREAGVDGEPRWGMLESICAYARERLEASSEAPEIHRLHAEYCVALAEAARAQIRGPEQSRWLERLEQDHDNIRAALAWSTHAGHDAAELGLRLCGALPYFWDMHGHASEGRRWLQAALELPAPPPPRARAQTPGWRGRQRLLCALRCLWLREAWPTCKEITRRRVHMNARHCSFAGRQGIKRT